MTNILIKRLRENVKLPAYQTSQSAAMDLHAAIEKPLAIKPMERLLVPCGFAISLPDGFEAQVRMRSGLAIKHGLSLANGIGTIDADFRGEVQVILINLGTEAYEIIPDERIAQLVIARFEKITWQDVKELPESDRASGGFGSTGK
jgi:dUTP pyrophosphatase